MQVTRCLEKRNDCSSLMSDFNRSVQCADGGVCVSRTRHEVENQRRMELIAVSSYLVLFMVNNSNTFTILWAENEHGRSDHVFHCVTSRLSPVSSLSLSFCTIFCCSVLASFVVMWCFTVFEIQSALQLQYIPGDAHVQRRPSGMIRQLSLWRRGSRVASLSPQLLAFRSSRARRSCKPDFGAENDKKYFDHTRLESDIYKWWEESGFFAPRSTSVDTVANKPFVVPMPPPNVTG